MGFFAAVVFLPRWFQVVGGTSATVSGYQMLPLLGGIILSATAAGQLVARTGRYRLLVFGAMVVMAAGLAMLTQLRTDTPAPLLWAWMFVTGLGVGPMFAVFPLIVQNTVPVTQIGAATSSVAFFQQVGGTVGLAITGTVFATSMGREVPAALGSAGVPSEVGQAFAGAGGVDALASVGASGAALLASLPAEVRVVVEPFLPAIVGGFHTAFSIATASTFAIGIATSLLAAALVLLFREAPAVADERESETRDVTSGEPSASTA
jgi:MFS family permease